VQRFTYTCLRGDWDAALEYLDDSAVQRVEFQRWRTQQFASILDKFRPSGDRVAVEVRLLKETDDLRLLAVTMSSAYLGSRSNVQWWRRSDGGWNFDAHQTLVEQNGVRAVRHRASSGRGGATPPGTATGLGRVAR
jgi:hypothetical protein